MTDNYEKISYDIAASDLAAYASLMWPSFEAPPHVRTICNKLMAIERGEIKRVIFTAPPRHSKSTPSGRFLPAWFLGRNPEKKVIYTTYGQGPANTIGDKVRNLIADPQHQMVFPTCELSPSSKSKHEFKTTVDGEYHAIGRGGPITSKGADLFVGDDLLKDHIEAASKTVRDNMWDWYGSVVTTRLQPGASIVLCGTRWNEDDLIGRVLKTEPGLWEVINFPAIDDQNEALWPEHYPLTRLEEIKKVLGPYFWNALYQGSPSPMEGNIFKRDKWRFWSVMPQCDYLIQSWDMNFKQTVAGSYVVAQVWGCKRPNFYLLDQIRGRWDFMEAVKRFVELTNRWTKCRYKVIEAKANGDAIISMFRNKTSGVIDFNPDEYGSKEARAQIAGIYQDSMNIYIPNPKMQGYEWVNEYIDRCASFPNIDDKDEIDAMSQAIIYLTKGQDGILRLDKLLTGL